MWAGIPERLQVYCSGAIRNPFSFHPYGLILKSALITLSLAYGSGMAAGEEKQEVAFDSVEVLSSTKARTESRVKLLRSLKNDGEIEEKDLQSLRLLYDEARADVNAGLDRILVELESTGTYESGEPFARVAERASKRAVDFLNKSDAVIFGGDRSGAVEAATKLADSLVGAFVTVWKIRRSEKSVRNEKLLERISSLKWESFDQIE